MDSFYQPPNQALWTGRATSNERDYWYQVVEMLDLTNELWPATDVAFIGYQCDEGVRLNQGRLGAKEGPSAIRHFLPKLPVHHEVLALADAGDLIYQENLTLEQFQQVFATQIARLLAANIIPIALGGGHDLSFAHFSGLHQALSGNGSKFGIISFDAHFDLREENQATSGTPFRQILNDFEHVNYLALGIQQSANTKELYHIAEQTNTRFLGLQSCSVTNIQQSLDEVNRLSDEVDHIYVTIDMDGFSSAYSPGVSAPSPFGLTPEYVTQVLRAVINTRKMVALDLAETNPTYDQDNATSRLAARLIWEVAQCISIQEKK